MSFPEISPAHAPENWKFGKISGWVFQNLPIRVNEMDSLDNPLYFFGRYFSINVEMKPIFALFLRYLSRLWRFFHHLINFPIYISFRDLKGFEIFISYLVFTLFQFFTIFFTSPLLTSRLWKSIYQMKAINYQKTMCIVWLYWPNCDVIKWRPKFHNLDRCAIS